MEFESVNDIIDFAIEKEIEAAAFYTEASKEESMSGAKEMFGEFALEERKHQTLLETLKKKGFAEGMTWFTVQKEWDDPSSEMNRQKKGQPWIRK